MKNLVMIKSFPNGLTVLLDPDASFQEIYAETVRKFHDSAKFFGEAKMVISFEGRELSVDEEKRLVDAICANSDLTVLCVVGKDAEKDQEYLKAASKFAQSGDHTDGQFYKGTIRAGQVLETDSSVIILGDINPGAEVISSGNIVILGTLYGHAYAGSQGNSSCFVVALDMKPAVIKIGEYEVKDPVRNTIWKNKQAPKIAFVEDDMIRTEAITTALLNHLQV
ncbi:MAG: septum site-determining protein MinC [Lachnospiraceae bacterium]|nr:septum site-determining protein MinC [Lachnospiraceae bacterium]